MLLMLLAKTVRPKTSRVPVRIRRRKASDRSNRRYRSEQAYRSLGTWL